jgi:hypothetical protein
MKKQILGICIVVLMLVALISGCAEKDNSGNVDSSEPKTVTMNAQEYSDDIDLQITGTSVKSDLKSLKDGDTLIFQDIISAITYDETTDITTVEFEYEEAMDGGGTYTSTVTLIFEGDITNLYEVGDNVKATLTIKRITVTINEMALDMEIYEEYWVSEEYFTSNYMTGNPYMPLSASKITKV